MNYYDAPTHEIRETLPNAMPHERGNVIAYAYSYSEAHSLCKALVDDGRDAYVVAADGSDVAPLNELFAQVGAIMAKSTYSK